MDTLAAIEKHGLAIRRVPLEVISCWSMDNHKPGNRVVESVCNSFNFGPWVAKHAKDPQMLKHYRVDYENKKIYRLLSQETKIPAHAGYWMVQPSMNTSSRMQWDTKRHHLAPTLAESVQLYLDSLDS